jgi:hypothetical protein
MFLSILITGVEIDVIFTPIAAGFCMKLSGFYCMNVNGRQTQLFFESAIAIPQLEGCTFAIAIPQVMKKCCSATHNSTIPQQQLQVCNLRPSLSQFLAVESGRFMKKNWKSKISCYCPFKESFLFPEKQTVLRIFLVDF